MRKANDAVERIAVLELWNIGDVILAMPFLGELRRLFPRAKITLVARPFAVDLLAGTALVDDVMVVDLAWSGAGSVGVAGKAVRLWQAGRQLRRRRFELAFTARAHSRERLLLWISGAQRRLGYAGGKLDGLLTHAVTPAPANAHKAEQWLGLLAPLGGAPTVQVPRLHVDHEERRWANGYLASKGVSAGEILVGVHPGASLVEKRWPLERFREVATAIAAKPGVKVLAFAEPSGYGSELFSIPRVVGATVSLRQLIALIARCSFLVCNDSGPMHIAAALRVPTVAMFGAGIETVFRPQGGHHQALSAPSEDAELHAGRGGIRKPDGIQTDQVLDAVGRALNLLSHARR